MGLRRLLLSILAAACQPVAAEPPQAAYDRRAGPVEYRIVQGTEGVIRVELRIIERQADPDLSHLEARCRREAAAIGLAEAARRRMPPPHRVFNQFIESTATHDARTGLSQCTAATPVFPSDGRPWGRPG